MTNPNPREVIGGNNPPSPFAEVATKIADLYGEAKLWADGEPITSAEMHDAVTKLYDGLHDAGRVAEELRKAEVAPINEAKDAVQAKFKPLSDDVTRGKAALNTMLAAWRSRVAAEKAETARLARIEAEEKLALATAAIRASAGNLEAREDAEALLKESKKLNAAANRVEKAPAGLRSVWTVAVNDEELALNWAYVHNPARFTELVVDLANEAVRAGARAIPGCVVSEEKRAV